MRVDGWKCRCGLTRLDLIVVLGIVFTLAGLLFTLLPRAHQSSDRVRCAFNLKQIGDAVQSFQARKNFLPAARIGDGYATWAVQVAPDLRSTHPDPLKAWDIQKPYAAQPAAIRQVQVTLFYCPGRRRPPQVSTEGDTAADGSLLPGALGDYACAAGDGDPAHPWDGPDANGPIILGEVLRREKDRVLEWRSRTTLKDLKGKESYTILIGDKHVPLGRFGEAKAGDGSLYNGANAASGSRVGGPGHRLAPAPDAPFNRNFGSYHPGAVCQFLMADNSVRPFTPALDGAVLGQLTIRPAAKAEKDR